MLFAVLSCCFYFLFSTLLLSVADIPAWGRISYPRTIVYSETIPVSVSYENISRTLQMHIKTVYRDSTGRYCGEDRYPELVSEVKGSGRIEYEIPAVASRDIARLRIAVQLFEVSSGMDSVGKNLQKVDQTLVSGWIAVSAVPPPMEKGGSTLLNMVSKGYKTGLWKDKRGDNSFSGWVVTLWYIFCSLFLLYFLLRLPAVPWRERIFWYVVCAAVVFLAINKQLDLQMLVTDVLRTAAREYQVYTVRKSFQIRVVSLFASLGLSFLLLLLSVLRNFHKSLYLAVAGVSCLFSFLVLRLISYHGIDAVFSRRIGCFTLFETMEIAGGFLICSSMAWYSWSRGKCPRSI